jgi:hypothetical protein
VPVTSVESFSGSISCRVSSIPVCLAARFVCGGWCGRGVSSVGGEGSIPPTSTDALVASVEPLSVSTLCHGCSFLVCLVALFHCRPRRQIRCSNGRRTVLSTPCLSHRPSKG